MSLSCITLLFYRYYITSLSTWIRFSICYFT